MLKNKNARLKKTIYRIFFILFFLTQLTSFALSCETTIPQISYPIKLMSSMTDWRSQDWFDSRGVTRIVFDSADNNLVLQCDLDASTTDRKKGEAVLDLKYMPFAETNLPFDFTDRQIEVNLLLPPEFIAPFSYPARPNGVQVFVQDENFNSYYGSWTNCYNSGLITVFARPSDPKPVGGYSAPEFDASKIRTIGIKIALNTLALTGV